MRRPTCPTHCFALSGSPHDDTSWITPLLGARCGHAHLHVRGRRAQAFARFKEKWATHAPRLDAIAVMLAAPPGLWIGDRSFLGARTAQ